MFRKNYLSYFFYLSIFFIIGCTDSEKNQSESFFQGKTITILVGSGPGGVTDTSARIIGRYLEKYIDGSPTIIVKNMPGGGSVTMSNHIFRSAPKDGLVLGYSLPAVLSVQLMEPNRAKYDGNQLNWIGSIIKSTNAISIKDSEYNNIEQLMRNGSLTIGATGRASPTYQLTAMSKALLGLDINIITGYEGSSDITLAMDRGEVDGQGTAMDYWSIARPEWLDNGTLTHLVHIGPRDNIRSPDSPHLKDLVSSTRDKQLVDFLEIGINLGWPLFAPPGVPEDRLVVIRNAFANLSEDQEMQQAIFSTMGAKINYTSASELTEYTKIALNTEQSIINEAKNILGL
ncbi:MAG: hypothetical protein CBC38_07365 [Gammaproteobacteria bacterium TMED78]|nr:MAG: hypothetical protein CBC38_07365 [Gammaproteobacteria bacterium TMED78]|tara:strand:- start:13778 stop:14809 length:1032 start_codon:yes stop_codon:yes gene_type:complete